MSPAKFHDLQLPKREINGPRPSPLKLHKDSHPIHKPASSSNSASSSSFMSSLAPVALAKKQQPVIIYTHSPKIIHTKARDFMALVQKLTGLSRARDETAPPQPQEKDQDPSLQNRYDTNKPKSHVHEDNESSSVLTNENYVNVSSSLVSPILNHPRKMDFADIPLFTPTNFFCSPKHSLRLPDYASNVGGSMSPSVFEFIKELPEY